MTPVDPMAAVEVLGWAGAAALLLAYGLVTRHPTAATGRAYLALNLAGSAGLAVNGTAHATWPSAALNLLWLAVGLTALTRHYRSARADPSTRPL